MVVEPGQVYSQVAGVGVGLAGGSGVGAGSGASMQQVEYPVT